MRSTIVKKVLAIVLAICMTVGMSGCFSDAKSGGNGWDYPRVEWLSDDVKEICSDVEGAYLSNEIYAKPATFFDGKIMVRSKKTLDAKSVEEILVHIIKLLEDTDFLDLLIDNGWFIKPYSCYVVFCSEGSSVDYAFSVDSHSGYTTVSVANVYHRCKDLDEKVWEIDDYIDIKKYTEYIDYLTIESLEKELRAIDDDIYGVHISERFSVPPIKNKNSTLMIDYSTYPSDDRAELVKKAISHIITKFGDLEFLDLLKEEGWFKDNEKYYIVFRSDNRTENDYVFSLDSKTSYIILSAEKIPYHKYNELDESEWDLSEYIDIGFYLSEIKSANAPT